MKLSVALAVYNEADFLPRCLDSVNGLSNEIVVVDGGSTDQTVVIAKTFKARIFSTNNPKMFHVNKQKAIDACRGDWILQLDADEEVTLELAKEIKKILIQKNNINGYWIPRRNFFLGRFLTKGGQYPDYTIRLYRRGKGYLPCKDVHEQAVVTGLIGYLKNPLLHYADSLFTRYLFRFNRYTSLLALDFQKKKIGKNLLNAILYFFIKPLWWFMKTYIRHKGFVDGWQGFVFSFFSSLRFAVAFIKYLWL